MLVISRARQETAPMNALFCAESSVSPAAVILRVAWRAFVVQDLDLASGLAEPGRWCEMILQFRLSHAPISDPELCFPKLTSTVNASLCKRWSVCPPHDPAAGAVKAENIESAAGGIY